LTGSEQIISAVDPGTELLGCQQFERLEVGALEVDEYAVGSQSLLRRGCSVGAGPDSGAEESAASTCHAAIMLGAMLQVMVMLLAGAT